MNNSNMPRKCEAQIEAARASWKKLPHKLEKIIIEAYIEVYKTMTPEVYDTMGHKMSDVPYIFGIGAASIKAGDNKDQLKAKLFQAISDCECANY